MLKKGGMDLHYKGVHGVLVTILPLTFRVKYFKPKKKKISFLKKGV